MPEINAIDQQKSGARPTRFHGLIFVVAAFVVAALAMLWCWRMVGSGLGLFIGAPLLATIFTPPLIVADRRWPRWMVAGACGLGVSLVLCIGLIDSSIDRAEWFRCSIILFAFILGLTGFATLLESIGIPSIPAAACTVFVGLLWLTWPVWLSPWMTQAKADWLTPANPLLAINGAVSHLGAWDRGTIAYQRLTVLNQDVPYKLPSSIFPAVGLHGMIAIGGAVIGFYCDSRGWKPRMGAP